MNITNTIAYLAQHSLLKSLLARAYLDDLDDAYLDSLLRAYNILSILLEREGYNPDEL